MDSWAWHWDLFLCLAFLVLIKFWSEKMQKNVPRKDILVEGVALRPCPMSSRLDILVVVGQKPSGQNDPAVSVVRRSAACPPIYVRYHALPTAFKAQMSPLIKLDGSQRYQHTLPS